MSLRQNIRPQNRRFGTHRQSWFLIEFRRFEVLATMLRRGSKIRAGDVIWRMPVLMLKFPRFELFPGLVLQREPACRSYYEPPVFVFGDNVKW